MGVCCNLDKNTVIMVNNEELSEEDRRNVTPDFPKETKCITICMPGSNFMHIVTYK
jgi:hypothetical protein